MILDNNTKQDQKFRLANQAVVAKFNMESNENLGLIRKISIDKSVMITINTPHLTWPLLGNTKHTFTFTF